MAYDQFFHYLLVIIIKDLQLASWMKLFLPRMYYKLVLLEFWLEIWCNIICSETNHISMEKVLKKKKKEKNKMQFLLDYLKHFSCKRVGLASSQAQVLRSWGLNSVFEDWLLAGTSSLWWQGTCLLRSYKGFFSSS